MSAASLIASGLKGEERIQLIARGKGEVKTVYAEALQLGEVRGYLHRENKNESVWIDEKARGKKKTFFFNFLNFNLIYLFLIFFLF